uniref:Reverse transcriptase RNase H-like domain-containing protein n=1 Tax=Vitis vinifera TaxID=29760 RepID=A5B5Z9_VITVI|nr:hypothetical protein VITISV_034349 [Vitis vinifera]
MALGCMLAQIDDSGKERAIYYLSKRMLEYEMGYVMIERLCLALVWATKILRHYMTEYSVHLISCLDPLRYLFDRPALTGRLMRWLVLLTEVDIQRSADGMLLLCLDRASADRVMREVHAGVCGLHMGGHILARKIMRTGYFWLTMETNCCQFVQKCLEYQIHGDLIHAPPSELHALTSPWPFSVWGATPYSLVYGMEAILPVETEMGSLRVALEQQISETEWAQARFDQLNLLDERRLRVADHVQAYQRNMARAFKKRVKPRPLQKGDLVLRILKIGDPRGKFRPSWSGPYVIRKLTLEGGAWLIDLDGNQFLEPTNVDQLKKYYV